MKTVGDKLEAFKVAGVKPGFNHHEENGVSAFEEITESSFPGKWKVIYFYPKDFTFVCPTELVEFNKRLDDFDDRDAVVIGASTDNEYSHLAWCKSHADLNKLRYPLIAAQKLEIEKLRRALYGARSERKARLLDQLELNEVVRPHCLAPSRMLRASWPASSSGSSLKVSPAR